MGFTLSQIIRPQFIAAGSPGLITLVVGTGSDPATATVIPAQVGVSLWTSRFVNVTSSPVALFVWRVTASGGGTGNMNLVIYNIAIPSSTFDRPYFEWNPHFEMSPGDGIYALAGAANAITVTGDGGITQ
jgi:hypothetical protein